jgi:hypothetical protein
MTRPAPRAFVLTGSRSGQYRRGELRHRAAQAGHKPAGNDWRRYVRACPTTTTAVACLGVVVVAASSLMGCHVPPTRSSGRWHENYSYVGAVPPITFHYDHGVLAGSYPNGVETVAIEFEDVCAQLGHVCLCGAGGFRVAGMVVEALRQAGAPLERGEFILISGREHTVSDVIAFVLGCTRRAAPEHNQYFIDDSIAAPRREYHYYVAYSPTKAAVHVVYRKHLLVGHEEMDRLWEIESAFERDPAAVQPTDVERYRRAMVAMVGNVLFDRVAGLITVEPVAYETFQSRLDTLRRPVDRVYSHP